jgi:uncharacterized integral membrane protein (TIGR00698 family)
MITIETSRWIERTGSASMPRVITAASFVRLSPAAPRRGTSFVGRACFGMGALAAVAVAGAAHALAGPLAALGAPASPLLVAILLGMVLAPFVADRPTFERGLACAGRPLLRLAIVLLGLRVGLPQLAALGAGTLLAVALLVAATWIVGRGIGKALGLSDDAALLLAAGHAVCGAAAIVAVDGVVRGKPRDVAGAVALVTVFGTVSMLALPLFGNALALTPQQQGIWAGASLHEVAQAVAAGHASGDEAGAAASLVKMARVALLLPAVWIVSIVRLRAARGAGASPAARAAVPWFVVGFLAVAALDAVGAVPTAVAGVLRPAGAFVMTVAMAAIGLGTSLRELRGFGWRPLVVAALTTIFVTAVGLAVAC